MNAVGSNDDIAIGERHVRAIADLLNANTTMPGAHHALRQRRGQYLDEVSAVHPECRVPAQRVGDLNRSDRRAVVAEIMRADANSSAPLLYRWSKANPLQLAHAVRCQEHPRTDLGEGRRLLVDGNVEAVGD